MPTEIDSLQISINAKAKSAEQSIDTLVAKLDKLSTSLGRINGSSLSGLASGVSKLGNATQTLKGVKATEYNRIASGFERFARIDSSGLSKTASGLNTLARSMASLSSIPNLGNTTSAINAIKNLARVDMSGFDTAKMNTIATTMGNFADKLSSVGKIDGSVTRVVSAMARLSNSGQYIGNVVTYFPQLGNQVVSLVGKLSSANAIDLSITKIVDGIARLASAGKKIEVTVANLGKLGDGVVNLLRKLQSAPRMSAELANIIQGLGNIASSGSRAGSVLNGLGGRASKTVGPFKRLSSAIMGTGKSTKGFVSSIGMFYAKFFLVIRAIKGLGKAIGSAQDYIEDFNYFSVALTKVGEDSRDNWKEAGYNSAQEYVDSFKGRFGELQKQMTGYTVDVETGELDYNIGHNLGLDISEVMRFQSSIAQITNSAGMLGETSIMTSKALSMLSADLSSLSNQDLKAVQDNLQSGLIGQSRALYKYGIDITQAGLQQTAYAHGLDVTVKNLSQASKMQLRLLTILGQSKVAYGDLARTINQPANQLRMLQAGFKNLARTVGQIFLPIVQKLYPYLNAMVMVLQEFAEWIAKLTGANLKGNDTAMNLPDYEPAEDGSEAVADNTEKASKSAKKLSDNLQGFDIINKLDSNNSDGKKDDEDGTPKDIDLSKQIASALGNYEKIWNEAWKSNKNKASQYAQKIKKAFLDGWKTGDYTNVGKAFAKWINKGLSNISWSKIKKNVKKVSSSIATFLNGYIKKSNWKLIGETLAEGFNTAVDGLYAFVSKFNWLQWGKKVSKGLNSGIKKFDWTKLGKTLGTTLRGVIQFAFGTLTNFKYDEFGKKIGNAINGFLDKMGKVDKRTGLTGWQELGKTISDSMKGILTTITTALDKINWNAIGKAISGFISELDWWEILKKSIKVIAKTIISLLSTSISALKNDPVGLAKSLSGLLVTVFAYKKLTSLWTSLSSVFGKGLSKSITDAEINSTKLETKFSNLGNKLGGIVGGAMGVAIGVSIASSLGSYIVDENISDKNILKKRKDGSYQFNYSTALGMALSSLSDPNMYGAFLTGNIKKYVDEKARETTAKSNAIEDKKISNIERKKAEQKIEKIKKDTGIDDIGASILSKELDVFAKEMLNYGAVQKDVSSYIQKISKNLKNGKITVEQATKKLKKMVKQQKLLKEAQGDASAVSLKFYTALKNIGYSEEKATEISKKYTNQLNEGKLTTKEFTRICQKYVGDAIKPAYSQTNSFAKGMDNLTRNSDNLGISFNKQKKYIQVLQKAVDSGAISLSKYRKITDNSKLSAEDLAEAIKKIKNKTAKIEINTEGKKNIEEIKNSIEKIENKEVKVKTKADKSDLSNLFDDVKNMFKSPITLTFETSNVTKILDKYNKLTQMVSKASNNPLLKKLPYISNGTLFVPKGNNSSFDELLKYAKKNKIPYKRYEAGGFPEDGWFRANHGEIMGKFDNGKSVVANNKQITDGIAKAVGPAVYSAVSQAMSKYGDNDKPVIINLDGKKIAESTIGHVNQMTKSRGRNPIITFG